MKICFTQNNHQYIQNKKKSINNSDKNYEIKPEKKTYGNRSLGRFLLFSPVGFSLLGIGTPLILADHNKKYKEFLSKYSQANKNLITRALALTMAGVGAMAGLIANKTVFKESAPQNNNDWIFPTIGGLIGSSFAFEKALKDKFKPHKKPLENFSQTVVSSKIPKLSFSSLAIGLGVLSGFVLQAIIDSNNRKNKVIFNKKDS